MSFGGTKQKTSTGSSTTNGTTYVDQTGTSGKEAWVQDEGSKIYNAAKDQAYKPYQAYEGERVAEYDGNFDSALNMVKDAAGNNQNLGSAKTLLDQIRSSFDPNVTTESLMNPYVGAALDPAIRKINEAAAQQRNAAGAQATMSGAYGDTGAALQNALLNRNTQTQIADTTASTYASAYDKALAQKNTLMGQMMQLPGMYTSLDAAGTGKTTTLANMLAGFSDKTRQVQQSKDNAGYSDFLEKRDWDQNQMAKLMQLLNMTPSDNVTTQKGVNQVNSTTNSTQTQTEPDNSGLALLGQLGGSLFSGGLSALTGGLSGMAGLAGGAASAMNYMPDVSLGVGKDSDWI